MKLEHANAICYSGYREGQGPGEEIYPSYEEIREDLQILARNWKYLRLYDPTQHAETVLKVIRDEGMHFEVMLGVDVGAEISNPHCPWGADYSDEELEKNRQRNSHNVDKAIALAKTYGDIVFSLSVGNEATVEWSDHLVPVESLLAYVRRIKSQIDIAVTFCENYVPWTNKLEELAAELDFLSVHTYPVWEYCSIDNALDVTKDNYYAVAHKYPDKPVVITEAGWTTQSNGRGIEQWNASEELQDLYYRQLMEWTGKKQIVTFVFEAFDEPWKGSDHPQEPEKHWGLFFVDRTPKQVMEELYR